MQDVLRSEQRTPHEVRGEVPEGQSDQQWLPRNEGNQPGGRGESGFGAGEAIHVARKAVTGNWGSGTSTPGPTAGKPEPRSRWVEVRHSPGNRRAAEPPQANRPPVLAPTGDLLVERRLTPAGRSVVDPPRLRSPRVARRFRPMLPAGALRFSSTLRSPNLSPNLDQRREPTTAAINGPATAAHAATTSSSESIFESST